MLKGWDLKESWKGYLTQENWITKSFQMLSKLIPLNNSHIQLKIISRIKRKIFLQRGFKVGYWLRIRKIQNFYLEKFAVLMDRVKLFCLLEFKIFMRLSTIIEDKRSGKENNIRTYKISCRKMLKFRSIIHKIWIYVC